MKIRKVTFTVGQTKKPWKRHNHKWKEHARLYLEEYFNICVPKILSKLELYLKTDVKATVWAKKQICVGKQHAGFDNSVQKWYWYHSDIEFKETKKSSLKTLYRNSLFVFSHTHTHAYMSTLTINNSTYTTSVSHFLFNQSTIISANLLDCSLGKAGWLFFL